MQQLSSEFRRQRLVAGSMGLHQPRERGWYGGASPPFG